MDIRTLVGQMDEHAARLASARAAAGDDVSWYQYDSLANFYTLDGLLTGVNRDLDTLASGMPVADIGAGDGDLAFVLEEAAGWEMDIVDTASTNQNGLRGARLLKDALGSNVHIHDIDLDSQFRLPRPRYGLVILLGILYHLQNPYFVLRRLAEHLQRLLLSTRVARYAGPESTYVGDIPLAYLLGPGEANNDPTNYWIFTPPGLERLVARTGWRIVDSSSAGETELSDPASADRDERMFLLLENGTPDGPPR